MIYSHLGEEYYDKDEALSYLGINDWTFNRLIRSGELVSSLTTSSLDPAVYRFKVGKPKNLYSTASLEAAMQALKVWTVKVKPRPHSARWADEKHAESMKLYARIIELHEKGKFDLPSRTEMAYFWHVMMDKEQDRGRPLQNDLGKLDRLGKPRDPRINEFWDESDAVLCPPMNRVILVGRQPSTWKGQTNAV